MSLRQDFAALLKKSQLIVQRATKFLVDCLEWVVASLIAAVLGIAIAVGKIAKVLYLLRSKIVGRLFLAGAIVLALVILNQIVGLKIYFNDFHAWFILDYHWAMVLGTVSITLIVTWEHVSPTLRTLFCRGWTRLVWALTGIILIGVSYIGLPQDDITYWGIYTGSVILYVIVLAVIANEFSPKGPTFPESPYIDDNPAGHEGSVPYETQKRTVANIRHLIESGKPSVVAITGHWGIGKTFLLLRAKKELEHHKSIIWMNFEPWRYASEEALIRGFYQDIGTSLADKIPGIQHIIKPLTEATDKFVRQHDGTGIFGAAMDVLHLISKPTENPEEQIKKLLAREGKRLVIVIDDVDRSFNPEQIFRTLQLAHFTKDINNVQVVFLYEKDIVLQACPEHHAGSSQTVTEYLEKFVGVEVFVPSPLPSELRQLFSSFMGIYRDRSGFNFADSDLTDEMLHAVDTPRRVKLLANEFVAFRANLKEGQK